MNTPLVTTYQLARRKLIKLFEKVSRENRNLGQLDNKRIEILYKLEKTDADNQRLEELDAEKKKLYEEYNVLRGKYLTALFYVTVGQVLVHIENGKETSTDIIRRAELVRERFLSLISDFDNLPSLPLMGDGDDPILKEIAGLSYSFTSKNGFTGKSYTKLVQESIGDHDNVRWY